MEITFKKQDGNTSLGVEFYWMMAIHTETPAAIHDCFIPELYFDYFFVKQGTMACAGASQTKVFNAGEQTLKTLHTHPLTFTYSAPVVLFGSRFSLRFVERYWEGDLTSGSFLDRNWVSHDSADLPSFSSQVAEYIESHCRSENAYPILSQSLEESSWLGSYSPRQKRRLYKKTFGISRKEMQSIRSIHSFLEQVCDFTSQNPRIIEHINPEVFYDQPHLNHAFKKWTGLSPIEYFETSTILQDNLMAASYNAISDNLGKI